MEKKEKKFYHLALELAMEKELDQLLGKILHEAMIIVLADGGRIYVHDVDMLYCHSVIRRSRGHFHHGRKEETDTPPVPFNSDSIVGRAAREQNSIFSKDMMVIPLLDDENDVVAVMELFEPVDEDGNKRSFDDEDGLAIEALTSFVGIIFNNKRLMHEKGELLQSFVSVMVGAVDRRSPYNAHHTKNMVRYAERFLEWTKEKGTPFLKGRKKDAFLISVWLHDIGKLLIPTEVMDKATRLGGELKDVLHRISIGILMEKLEGTTEKIYELEIARDFIIEINKSTSLSEDSERKLKEISTLKCMDEEGIDIPLLTNREIESLGVKRGNLTAKERNKIQDHVVYTRYMLDGMNFSGRYRAVPKIAGDHHELLDGSGYPNKLSGDKIKKETRLLTILDIFDALTAEDRPYKPSVPPERAFKILYEMANEGKLDRGILSLFKESRVWEKRE